MTVMSPAYSIVENARVRRIPRGPSHTFYLQTKPFGIYPFMLAPVLPGETLKNLQLQSRVVTDPVVSPLVGWWKEYYFFYIKLRDLPAAIATAVETMLLDPSATLATVITSADSTPYYYAPGSNNAMNWQIACMERVVECYFRDQDETWNTQTIDGVPKAKFQQRDFTDSMFATSELPTASLTGNAEDLDDVEIKWRNWQLIRQQMLTDMTFEEYLATFGVRVPGAGKNKPELLRYIRDWSYPSNTVDPGTGVPASAVSWSVAERADKDRFFTEPGFIFGVTVSRPKAYRSTVVQPASVMLDDALAWMPAILKDDPSSSLKEIAAASPARFPTAATYGANLTLDLRDLYVHGDQWYRTDNSIVDAAGEAHALAPVGYTHFPFQYPIDADIAKLWSDRDVVDPAHTASKIFVREDGVVKMTIMGTQMDYT